MSVCPSICLPICPSACLFVSMFKCLSVELYVWESVCLSVQLYACLNVFLSIFLYVNTFKGLPIFHFPILSVHLSICLSNQTKPNLTYFKPFVCLSNCQNISVYISYFLPVHLYVHQSVCSSVPLYVSSSVPLYVCPSVTNPWNWYVGTTCKVKKCFPSHPEDSENGAK